MNEEYDILAETLEIPDPTERAEFLTGRCGQDTDLFRKVNALLAKALDEETKFGKYVVEREIRAGGMGKVYLASFTEEYEVADKRKTFSKKVALKKINPNQKDELKNGLKATDDRWLLNLEQNSINLDPAFEQRSFSYVYTDNGIVYDTTGHYSLPWSIVATADIYENSTAWQKAVEKKWIDNYLKTGQEGIVNLTQKNAEKYWVSSEYLYALRRLFEN